MDIFIDVNNYIVNKMRRKSSPFICYKIAKYNIYKRKGTEYEQPYTKWSRQTRT